MHSQNRVRAIVPSLFKGLGLTTCVIALSAILAGAESRADETPSVAPAPPQPAAVGSHPRFTSTAYVAVKTKDLAELEIEQQTQAHLLVHGRLISRVLETSEPIRQTEWFKQFVFAQNGQQRVDIAAAKADLLAHFEATVIPKSRLIEVRMSFSDAKDCQTIVREIVDAHIKEERQLSSIESIERAQAMEQLKLNYESQIRDVNSRILRIATDLGSVGVGVGPGPDSKDLELQQMISEQLKMLAAEGDARASLKTFDEQMQANSAPELAEAVEKNATCLDYRRRVDELDDAADDMEATLGAKDAKTIAAKRRLDHVKKKLDDAESDVKARTAELTRAKLQNALTSSAASLKRIDERINELRSEISSLAKMKNEYEHLQSDLHDLRSKLDKEKEEQDRLGFLNPASSPLSWATLPDLPE